MSGYHSSSVIGYSWTVAQCQAHDCWMVSRVWTMAWCKWLCLAISNLEWDSCRHNGVWIQSIVVIMWSNLSWYYIRHCDNSGRKWISFRITTDTHSSPMRVSYGVSIVRIWGKLMLLRHCAVYHNTMWACMTCEICHNFWRLLTVPCITQTFDKFWDSAFGALQRDCGRV